MLKIRSLPFLLYSYIAAELLAPFFASFIILYGVFFLIRLSPLLEIVLSLRIGFADFIRLISYIFPHMLFYVIPMASMTGVIIGFTRLTNDREILALKSCGVSLIQMLPPVVLIAFTITSLTGFFSLRLIPAGEISMRQLMLQLAMERIDKGLDEKTFTEALGDLVVYVDRVENNEWHGVYVSDMRDRTQPIITIAEKGHMVGESKEMLVTIVLNNGTMHNSEKKDNQVIQFKQYQLQIPLNPPTVVAGSDVSRISRSAMSQQQLLEAAKKYGAKSKQGVRYLTEFHHRLNLPVGCFLLSLLGIPLGLQAGPGKKAAGIPLGLGFFVLYYISFTTFRVLCEDRILPVVLGMWMPNIIFLLLTIWVFWRVDREKPIFSARFNDFVADNYDALLKFIKKQFIERTTSVLLRKRPLHELRHTENVSLLVHANSHSMIFHLPGCEFYDCLNCNIEFKDAEVALRAGFAPCRFCKTILEKNKEQ